ncbi:MAG: phospholipid carrier-dependent glycosyltransferase [Acidobacteria bacterium]|nr:phospholipid carrier-dependent glycosyltransferase [Acidobacteriota bacterium]
MKSFRWDVLIEIVLVGIIIGSFFVLASQKIQFHPAPWKDEPWLMQPAYQVLKTGKMSLPMFRHFNNEIGERIFTNPVFTYLLAGWFSCFGFGILQARMFNLTLSIGVLLIVYLIGRSWGGRVTGIVAITLLACDNNYFTGSRFLRNDFISVFFAITAAFSYLKAKFLLAQTLKSGRGWLIMTGVLATLSVFSHLNGLYVVILLGIWLFIDYGWRMLIKLEPWIVAISINLFALPYALYCWSNREVYLAQFNILAKGRAKGLTLTGLGTNILAEPKRYANWDDGVMFMTTNYAVLFFKILTIIAVIYLFIRIIRQIIKKESLSTSPYIYSLTAIICIVVFFATEVSNKTHSYLPHLTVWFALAIGITLNDLVWKLIALTPELSKFLLEEQPKEPISKEKRLAARVILVALMVMVFTYTTGVAILTYKYQRYLTTLTCKQNKQLATVLHKTVTPNLIPIGVPTYWHLFARVNKNDYRVFSRYLMKKVLKGEYPNEQYAFICDKRQQKKLFELTKKLGNDVVRPVHLLVELPESPYGKIWIYYIGKATK